MTKKEMDCYTDEIELAVAQNGYVEVELNSLVACLIRQYGEHLSVRDVTTRRWTKISYRFFGKKGFPDYVILERKKSRNAKIYGVVEIKAPGTNLNISSKQIEGHLKSFHKVIFTNGLEWHFLEKRKIERCICIGELDSKGNILNTDPTMWIELCDELSKFF